MAKLSNSQKGALAKAILFRGILASAGWWVISEGQVGAAYAGLAAVIAAVALSLVLLPPARHRVAPGGLFQFAGYFLGRSFLAGFDVAWRILHPRLQIDPALVRVPLTLTAAGPRSFLIQVLSLVPGTLSLSLEGNSLVLHCLNQQDDISAQVRAMEARVARLFGLTLEQKP